MVLSVIFRSSEDKIDDLLAFRKYQDRDVQRRQEERQSLELSHAKGLSDIALQVAHDIRSPIAALSTIIPSFKVGSAQERLILSAVIDRINQIANQLLFKYRSDLSDGNVKEAGTSVQLISHLIRPLLVEKNYQYKNNQKIKIEAAFDGASYGLFAKVNAIEYQRVLSNLLNNAFEAISETGIVIVTLSRVNHLVQLKVQDNGKGISSDELLKIGQKGVSLQKQGGSGLGLSHARANAEEWSGRLEIQSRVGEGTSVMLELPMCPQPAWFLPQLELAHKQWVTIVDDDPSIFLAWRTRLRDIDLEIFYLPGLDDLEAWCLNPNRPVLPTTFLVDFEFEQNRELNVFEVLKKLNILNKSVVVTSHFSDTKVQQDAERMGVLILPKDLLGIVPIRVVV